MQYARDHALLHKYVPVVLTGIVVIVFTLLTPFIASPANLFTDEDIARAKEHVRVEPLRSYAERLRSSNPGHEAAAILYSLTGEPVFATAAKASVKEDTAYLRQYVPYMVDIWILRSPFKAVSALITYDLTCDSGIYSDEEAADIHDTLSWTIDHYLNRGTAHIGSGFMFQTDYIPEDMDDWVIANMNVHRLLAVGLYGLVFPDDPRADEIVKYAVDYFERVLSLGARPGGAWAENPRYAEGVLKELYILATVLKNAGERDFFADSRFQGLLSFFAESIPAPGITHPYRPLMVAADDAHWWESRTAILSWAASRFEDHDPDKAGEMMWCWRNQDSPLVPESLLFVDPAIESKRPSYGSYLPGMGYVVFRDRFAEPDETFFFATFGPEYGTSNRTMHHAPKHGDFSLIWRGHPVMLTRGCSSYVWSRRMRDQVDFAGSLVTYDDAGNSIEIPERRYDIPALEVNEGVEESLARDYYSDGVTHYISAETFNYAAGEVRNWDSCLPAPFNVRHFLFLKPDVFVIWDQVRSSWPMQWNIHLPATDVNQTETGFVTTNEDGISLAVDFVQDTRRDITIDWPLESIRADWPLVLSLKYGKGTFVFNALDITRQILHTKNEGARRILNNIISFPRRPESIGLIETDGQTSAVLDQLGYNYTLLSYDDLAGDLSRFDSIMAGQFAVLVRDRDMWDYREKLWRYVEDGGVCLWMYQYAWGWKPGDLSGPGYFPKTLMVGEGTSVVWGEGIELDCPVTMNDSPLWDAPDRITSHDWEGWAVGEPDTFKVMPIYPVLPNTDRARNIPVYYSDYWQVLASARKTYNITPPQTRSRFGPYRWIKAHHEPSDDFLTVLRPFSGDSPRARIADRGERDVTISQDGSTWRILTGNHDGIIATLTAMRYASPGDGADTNAEPLELLAVDALTVQAGSLPFVFDAPATIHLDMSPDEWCGTLSSLEGCSVSLPRNFDRVTIDGKRTKMLSDGHMVKFRIDPGEFSFRTEGNELHLERTACCARLEVRSPDGQPMQWVQVLKELPDDEGTWFQGATDRNGALTMRWTGDLRQTVILKDGDKKTVKEIGPGIQKLTFK